MADYAEAGHRKLPESGGDEERYGFMVWNRWRIVRVFVVLVITLFLTYVNYFNQDLLFNLLPEYYRGRIAAPQPAVTPLKPLVKQPSPKPPQNSPTPRPTVALTPLKLGHGILFAGGHTLYVTDGETERELTALPDAILSILPSPGGEKIALTYKSDKQDGGWFDYYHSRLAVFYPETGQTLEVISSGETSVTYPVWSSDGRYLSFWVGSGDESFVYDTDAQIPVFSVKGTRQEPVSPIMFSGDGAHILYIEEGKLKTALPDGTGQTALSEDARATRPVHEGPTLPNLPVSAPDGASVFYYASNGDFLALDLETGTQATVAAGIKSEMFSYYPNAYPVGFTDDTKLLFYAYDSGGGYQFGNSAPLYIFDTSDMTRKDFGHSGGMLAGGGADLNGTFTSPDRKSVVVHSVYTGHGLDLYDMQGRLLNSCSATDFRYSFYNWGGGTNYQSNLAVWSPDGKLIVSEPAKDKPLQVIDPLSCTVFSLSNTPYSVAVWKP